MPKTERKAQRVAYTLEKAKQKGIELPISYVINLNRGWASIKKAYKQLGLDWSEPRESVTKTALRLHLEWSWNYGIAEGFMEDTVKSIARSISDGIGRGEDQDESDLWQDFLDLRVFDGSVDEEWMPEDEAVKAELLERLKEGT